jgi:sterol desaturase/sphingolipid hydroxylase (fatty acid hydroxylase superfamily)
MRSACRASNSGLYFNFWDRWMGTKHPDSEKRFRVVTSR